MKMDNYEKMCGDSFARGVPVRERCMDMQIC